MKKHYIIDSQIESELIDCTDDRTEVEVLDEYIKQLRYRYGEVEVVEDHGGRKILKLTFEAKAVAVPTKEEWNSIEKWNYI